MLKEVKLPGGCYLADKKPEGIRKIPIRNLDIIPFKRYRLRDEADEYEETGDSLFEGIMIALGIMGVIAMGLLI